jgi:hypothetical protein
MAFSAFHRVAMRFSDEEVACRAELSGERKCSLAFDEGARRVFEWNNTPLS